MSTPTLTPRFARRSWRPVILLDVDDVLANFVGKLLRLYNADHGSAFTAEDLTSWDMSGVLGPHVYDYFDRPGLFGGADLAPMPGAEEAVARLSKRADCYAVTSLPVGALKVGALSDRRDWLKRYFPSLKGCVIASKKHCVWGDVLLDDRPANLEGGDWLGVLMDRPHNRSATGQITRVHGWGEAEEFLELYLRIAAPVLSWRGRGWRHG